MDTQMGFSQWFSLATVGKRNGTKNNIFFIPFEFRKKRATQITTATKCQNLKRLQ
jgi:hypothetical protein